MVLRHPLSCLSVALVLVIIAASGAGAVDCGGAVPCQCGDRVTANRTLACGVDPVTTTVCTGDGLIVAANVTLSLGGCTIAGDSKQHVDSGIVIAGDNVTVRNGKVTNFGFGVRTVPGSPTTGSTLASLQVFENGEGIRFLAIGSTLTGLTVRDNDRTGIDTTAMTTLITKSVLRRNGGACMIVQAGPWLVNDNTISLNRCEDNAVHGLQIRGAMNTIARNILLRNGSTGADIDGSGHVIDRNQAKYNGGDGFRIEGDGATVTLNIAQSNGVDGFTVSASSSAFTRNTSNYNHHHGIHEEPPASNNTYSGNNCTGNDAGDSLPPGLC